jgi:glycerol-3-phosphate dehydrogenase
MARQPFDLLVIGGGIYGACVAWDAALRGLRVALVERADFGQATSANSLKTLHGGLRYLQEANLPLMRLMIRERRTWLRIAPAFVRPLPFLLPTGGGKLTQHKRLLQAALGVNDLMSWDRNRAVVEGLHLPGGRILTRDETLRYLPGLAGAAAGRDITGGALWYDAQVEDTEQLLRAVLEAAVQHGAAAANYTEVSGFLQENRRVHGVQVIDRLSGQRYQISATLVVNCAGAWSDQLLAQVSGVSAGPTFHLSTAINLVTRQILPDVAAGLPSRWRGRSRTLFVAPWRDCSLVGTWHAPYMGRTPDYQVDEATIGECLAEINAAYPGACLSRQDVRQVHMGYLPMDPASPDEVRLLRKSMIRDHAQTERVEGLLSVIGVKYTTARHTAACAVDAALRKLRRPHVPCATAHTPLGGRAAGGSDLPQEEERYTREF